MAETHRTAQPAQEALADSSQVGASRTTSDSAWGVGLGLDLYIAASIQKQPSCVDNTVSETKEMMMVKHVTFLTRVFQWSAVFAVV